MINNIRYLCNTKTGIELILCNHSTITYPMHNHVSVLTIGILFDGSITLTVNQDARVYGPNETFVLFPYTPHSISTNDSYTMLSLCIDKQILNRHAIQTIQDHIRFLLRQALNREKISQYPIEPLFDRLNEVADFSDLHFETQNPSIENLKTQLELHPEYKFTVADMAQTAFVSKYHFIRNFKAEIGLTPHQFQIQNRIRKAQRLIHKADTLTEVALTTGFCDQSHFIKQFKKYVGLSPFTYKSSSRILE